jgi:hypothetical protein
MHLTIDFSSGTFRALQIANSYPDSVGRFVLDGVVAHGVVRARSPTNLFH